MNVNHGRRVFLGLLFCAVGGMVAAAEDHEEELVIGLIPEMNVFEQVARFEGLAEQLSEQLHRPVLLTMISGYGNVVDRLAERELDAAFLGSYTGTWANSQLAMQPVARPVNCDGTSTYRAHIFVRRDSGINDVADMKDKRLALVDKATTAGYLFPLAHFTQHGVGNLEDYFSEVRFWGSHDAAVLAVLEGEADVGAAKNTVFEALSRSDPRIERELRILVSSPDVPSNALFVASSVDIELKSRIRSILTSLHRSPKGQKVLRRLGAIRFESTFNEEYGVVLDLAAKAGIDFENDGDPNQ